MKQKTPISIAGVPLGESAHACAFFHDELEEYETLLPFIREGFDRGERALHVVDTDRRIAHLRRLAAAGIDTVAAERAGQLDLRTNTETYLKDGRFDQDRMLATFEQIAADGLRSGFPRSRIICHMEWASGNRMLLDPVVEFEARVNDVWRRHQDVVICTYRLAAFTSDVILDILRTHPVVIIGGTAQQNPFYVPPERFLAELRERRARQAT